MKHWYRTLPAKIICFILCVVCLIITAASIIGATLMIACEFYVLPKEYVVESTFEDMLRSESNNILWHHLYDDEYYKYYVYDFDGDSTNVRYNVIAENGSILGANTDISDFDFSFKWILYKDENGNFKELDYYFEYSEYDENTDIFTVNMSVDTSFPVRDGYFFFSLLFDITYALLYWIYPIGILSLGLCVTSFIILMCGAGRTPQNEEMHFGPFYKIPLDLLIAALTALFVLATYLITEEWYTGEIVTWVLMGILTCIAVNVLLGLCISISARIKGKTFFTNTLIWIIVRSVGKGIKWFFKCIFLLIRAIPIVWKTALIIIGNALIDIFILGIASSDSEVAIFLWSIKLICTAPAVIYIAFIMRKLEKGGKAIAKGDLSYKVDIRGMLFDFRRHGENLNSISSGMHLAVEERLKSERTKTELITNVSHDIKTPITSIINYSSLISKESCNCERHKEYSEVLVRKSEHLKRLLDDLVEVSKATTGNLDVSLEPCDAGVLLTQVTGEFSEQISKSNLNLVCNIPDQTIKILADSRRIWRVFENLLSNACKYSLPLSRIYIGVEQREKEAVFTIKNTSLSPLNISPDELMQRFVRGDSSRSTEGNGLGLSIAKSLTELQGGKMDITIDGDLFKVSLSFKTI